MTARDTSREAREAQRKLGAAARVGLAFEMSAEARRISIAGMRSRDPALSEAAARARLLRRLLGAELYAAAYARRSWRQRTSPERNLVDAAVPTAGVCPGLGASLPGRG